MAPLFLMALFEPERKKYHRPNAKPATRIIIMIRNLTHLPTDFSDLLLISFGTVIQQPNVKNKY
jgi:hypothetical protein